MRRSGFKKGILISLILMAGLGVMLSPVFNLAELQITGADKLTEQWIRETAGAAKGVNLFLFRNGMAVKELKKNPYVEEVKIRKVYPQTLLIEMEERELSGYVKYLENTYLYIDAVGTVLEVSSFFTEQLPVVVGLQFNEFSLGKVLQVKNPASFDVVVLLAQLFKKYEMEAQVIRIDVSDVSDIHLYIAKIDIKFGNSKGADEKVRTIKASMEKLPSPDLAGTLDVSDTSSPISRFRILK